MRKSFTKKTAMFVACLLVFVGASLNFLLIYQCVFNPFQMVRSNSMAPGIDTDDAVILKDVDIARIEVGEVIIFRDPEVKDQFVIHRVMAIEDTGYTRMFTTKGDNNPVADSEKVAAGAVVGGVLARFPRFGLLLDYIGKPPRFPHLCRTARGLRVHDSCRPVVWRQPARRANQPRWQLFADPYAA